MCLNVLGVLNSLWEVLGLDSIQSVMIKKIVLISCAKAHSFVYAVKSGIWCGIASPKPQSTYVSYQVYIFCGVFHWEVQGYHIESQDKGISCILTFDLNTHVFGMIMLLVPGLSWVVNKLTTIQGSLALISCESYLIRYGEILLGLWF